MEKESIAESELILNQDGSIYHLNLLPEDISDIVVTVGDQDRVARITSYFDKIEVQKENREFTCHTGFYNNRRISVLSTGIGTDNIDIVLNELDALVNIDFKTRKEKGRHRSINIIRLGTSGCMDPKIPLDSILLSTYGLGMDGLMNYYKYNQSDELKELLSNINSQTHFADRLGIQPYLFAASSKLLKHFNDNEVHQGITTTCAGFYGPQGRNLRLETKIKTFLDPLRNFEYKGHKCTNFEMETAGIYGMAKLLGHHAISINVLVANRANKTFSSNPKMAMEQAIKWTLEKLTML